MSRLLAPPARRWLIGLLIAAVVVLGVLLLWTLAGPKSGVDRVRSLVSWPGSCISVDTDRTPRAPALLAWPHAVERASVICTNAGPSVGYARFSDRRALREDLLRAPPGQALCLADDTVVTDGLDPGAFAPLCRKLDGRLVDETVGIPDPDGVTLDEVDRNAERHLRRASAAQGRALRRLWAAGR